MEFTTKNTKGYKWLSDGETIAMHIEHVKAFEPVAYNASGTYNVGYTEKIDFPTDIRREKIQVEGVAIDTALRSGGSATVQFGGNQHPIGLEEGLYEAFITNERLVLMGKDGLSYLSLWFNAGMSDSLPEYNKSIMAALSEFLEGTESERNLIIPMKPEYILQRAEKNTQHEGMQLNIMQVTKSSDVSIRLEGANVEIHPGRNMFSSGFLIMQAIGMQQTCVEVCELLNSTISKIKQIEP